jgi:hypothetical protein
MLIKLKSLPALRCSASLCHLPPRFVLFSNGRDLLPVSVCSDWRLMNSRNFFLSALEAGCLIKTLSDSLSAKGHFLVQKPGVASPVPLPGKGTEASLGLC